MHKHEKSIFILCYLAYSSIYIARLNLTAASPYLQSMGLLTEVQLGSISSVFLIVYAFGRLFNGALCDKFQPRLMIFTGCLFIGMSNLLLGLLLRFQRFVCFGASMDMHSR